VQAWPEVLGWQVHGAWHPPQHAHTESTECQARLSGRPSPRRGALGMMWHEGLYRPKVSMCCDPAVPLPHDHRPAIGLWLCIKQAWSRLPCVCLPSVVCCAFSAPLLRLPALSPSKSYPCVVDDLALADVQPIPSPSPSPPSPPPCGDNTQTCCTGDYPCKPGLKCWGGKCMVRGILLSTPTQSPQSARHACLDDHHHVGVPLE
jgi:hypothetical protein